MQTRTSAITALAEEQARATAPRIGWVGLHGWLIAAAMALAVAAGLAMRVEWLTPQLDAMQARTFGVALTAHGALSFYFVLIPSAFIIPMLMIAQRGRADGTMPFPRLVRTAAYLQAAGLLALLMLVLTGGSEAGWNGASIFGGSFNDASLIGLAGLLAALAMVAQGVHAAMVGAMANGTDQDRTVSRVALFTSGVMALPTGGVLALCMASVLMDGLGVASMFNAAFGGNPALYERLFQLFKVSALALCCVTPAFAFAALASRDPLGARAQIALRVLAAVALVAAVPIGGILLSWKYAMAAAVFFGLGVFSMRRSRGAPEHWATYGIWAMFWISGIQGLMAGFMTSLPGALSIFSQTTLESAALHMTALAAFGFGLPAVWLASDEAAGRASRAPRIFFCALVLFAGVQLTFLPDALLGLRGLSYRANAYPAEFQVLKIFGTAGSTVMVTGLALVFGSLLFRKPRAE